MCVTNSVPESCIDGPEYAVEGFVLEVGLQRSSPRVSAFNTRLFHTRDFRYPKKKAAASRLLLIINNQAGSKCIIDPDRQDGSNKEVFEIDCRFGFGLV
jgi:hypothetical protein